MFVVIKEGSKTFVLATRKVFVSLKKAEAYAASLPPEQVAMVVDISRVAIDPGVGPQGKGKNFTLVLKRQVQL